MASYKEIRELLLFSVENNTINEEEFFLLSGGFKSHCQRKPGGAKRLGSADFLYFFSIKNQADKINFGDINKISRLFTLEIDHPPCFWPREALKTAKNNGNFSGLKQFFLKELVDRFFF